MESMASRARTLDSHLELIHAMSAVTAILFGISLALSLSIALWDVRAGSPRAAGEIANEAGLSSMLFGSLYTRTSRYEKVLVRQWREIPNSWRWRRWARLRKVRARRARWPRERFRGLHRHDLRGKRPPGTQDKYDDDRDGEDDPDDDKP